MYPLGHLGISLTATRLLGYAGYAALAAARKPKIDNISARARAWISTSLDARFLLLGAVLPDLIDKPIGLLIIKPSIAAGHALFHTLLFAIILFAIAVAFRGTARKAIFALAVGVTWHLVLDYTWQDPKLLLWPLLGEQFERGPSETTLSGAVQDAVKWLVTSPDFILGEIAGGAMLLLTFIRLDKKAWRNFIRRGEL